MSDKYIGELVCRVDYNGNKTPHLGMVVSKQWGDDLLQNPSGAREYYNIYWFDAEREMGYYESTVIEFKELLSGWVERNSILEKKL